MIVKAIKRFGIVLTCRHLCTTASLNGRRGQYIQQDRRVPDEEEEEELSDEHINKLLNTDFDALQNYSAQIERDAEQHQKHISYKTIERKYFKKFSPPEPCFLTWAMKEQLRYLHANDPEAWTPDTLAAAFPISPTGVKKLLKSRWVPENEDAIKNHDMRVLERWKDFTNGRLGSMRLLEQVLNLRSREGPGSALVLSNANDQLISTMESLKFDDDVEPYQPRGLRFRNNLPKGRTLKSGSFSNIIEDYRACSQKQSTTEQDTLQCDSRDLSAFVSQTPKYDGTYSQVASRNSSEVKNRRTSRKYNKKDPIISYHEFLKRKAS